jgi:diguanylate cyclase (GGDEF)-like protein/PAS domain S-box-containing protein
MDLLSCQFTYVGPQAAILLGYPLDDWYKDGFWLDHLHPEDREETARLCQEATSRCEDHETEYRMLAADDRIVWLRDIVTVVPGEDGPKMRRGLMIDITERKRAEENIRRLAFHDALTGLPNRRLFDDRFGVALAQARRRGQTLAIVSIDLDFFKQINDTFGHAAGDFLLRAVAERLSALLREGDTIARLGGDEFLLLLPGPVSREDLTSVAQRGIHAFDQPFHFDGRDLRVTVSIGISLYPKDGDDAETLVKMADAAMYRVKESGRNNYQFAAGSDREILAHLRPGLLPEP